MQDAEQQQVFQPAPQTAPPAEATSASFVVAPQNESSSVAETTTQVTPVVLQEGVTQKQSDGQRHKRPPRSDNKSKNFQRRNKPQHGGNGNGDRGFDRNGDNDEGADEVESSEPLVLVPLDPTKAGASRQGQTWTSAERQQVSNAYREGMLISQISFASGRSEFAVACHLEYAGLLGRGEALQYAKKVVQAA